MLSDVRAKWPMVLGPNGNQTSENCYFVLGVKATAPTKVHVLYSQM